MKWDFFMEENMKEKLNDLVELCKEEIKTIKNEADYLNLKSKF